MESIKMISSNSIFSLMNGLRFYKQAITQCGLRLDIELTVLYLKIKCTSSEDMMEVNSLMISLSMILKQSFGLRLLKIKGMFQLQEILTY